jgi:hypothetical protein
MLSPWIYKTRMGIDRTLERLEKSWLIQLPFLVYAALFVRITNTISRQQEFAADALAARAVGPQALAEGLKEIHRAATAFAAFWQNEYLPAFRDQLRPSLAAGFSRFMAQDQIADLMDSALQEKLTTAKADPDDTHPPLPERCATLARLEQTEGVDDTRESITLLHGLPELERDLLGITVGAKRNEARPVSWDEIPELVWYPKLRDKVKRQAGALRDATVADAASISREPQAIAQKLWFAPDYLPDMEQRCGEARRLIAAALTVALVGAGWRMKRDPGGPITCIREEFWSLSERAEVLEPLKVVAMFESGELSPQAWRELCDRLGISALRLALSMPASAPAR